jgi:hypothetical protein
MVNMDKIYNICNKYKFCTYASNKEYEIILTENVNIEELARRIFLVSEGFTFTEITNILIKEL